jgi:glycerol-3-phosphate dehydrogenase
MKRDLDALTAREHDVLVVGGGIHGAAVAWEAASRGLSAALVEAVDFGAGTSWNSLKTIHGGLRHLQRADVAGLRESARERRAWLTIAPRLVRPLAFLVPTYGHGPRGREAVALGLLANDVLTADRNRGVPADRQVGRGRLLPPHEVRRLVPGLDAAGLTGGGLWWDAQVDSTERLLLSLVHAATGAGAVAANHVEVTALEKDGGRVRGARARDALGGRDLRIQARVVVNAAGPAVAALAARAGIAAARVPHLEAANLVLVRRLAEIGVGARVAGRYFVVVPWRDRSLVGTAYAPEGTPRPALVADLLEDARRGFPWARLEASDVALVHHGRVPGEGDAAGLWSRSRVLDHRVDGVAGLISLVGVKYTTARTMAERAIDLAFAQTRRPFRPSRTAVTPLAEADFLDGSVEMQVHRAVRDEMAMTLSDAVLRRLDLGTAGPVAPSALEGVTAAMARALGWSDERIRSEQESFAADAARAAIVQSAAT